MNRRLDADIWGRFLLCLSAWTLCLSRHGRAEGITQFTERYVMVNVDGEEIIDLDDDDILTNMGICPYVEVFLEGEVTGSVSRLLPEDSFLCGSHTAGQYFRIGVGEEDYEMTIPATGEETEIPWYILAFESNPFWLTEFMHVRGRKLTSQFDGRALQTGFQVYYQNREYITSGLLTRVAGYAGTENKGAVTVYEEWFRARYNHNYEICYDYGFVNAEKRGISSEQGTLRENLSYFALPKQLTDPDGDSRYQFLGWRLSGDGGEYTPAQGSDKASFRLGQPAGSSAFAVNLAALSLADPEVPVDTVAEKAAAETTAAAVGAAAETKLLQGMTDGVRSTASTLHRAEN